MVSLALALFILKNGTDANSWDVPIKYAKSLANECSTIAYCSIAVARATIKVTNNSLLDSRKVAGCCVSLAPVNSLLSLGLFIGFLLRSLRGSFDKFTAWRVPRIWEHQLSKKHRARLLRRLRLAFETHWG